jgi:hypothetical protein
LGLLFFERNQKLTQAVLSRIQELATAPSCAQETYALPRIDAATNKNMIWISKFLTLLCCFYVALLPTAEARQLEVDNEQQLGNYLRSLRYFRSANHTQSHSQSDNQSHGPIYSQSYSLPPSPSSGKLQPSISLSQTTLSVGLLIGVALSVVLCAFCTGECLVMIGTGTMIVGIALAFYLTSINFTLRPAFLVLLGFFITGSVWIGVGQHKMYSRHQAEVASRRWVKRAAMKLATMELQGYELVVPKQKQRPLQNRGGDTSETDFLTKDHPDSFDAMVTL